MKFEAENSGHGTQTFITDNNYNRTRNKLEHLNTLESFFCFFFQNDFKLGVICRIVGIRRFKPGSRNEQ